MDTSVPDLASPGASPHSDNTPVTSDIPNTYFFPELQCTLHLINNTEQVIVSLDKLRSFSVLAIDCEGVDLGSHSPSSSLSILHISTGRNSDVFCFDIFTLGADAFSTTTPDGFSLKFLLESSDKRKLLWDLRSDASALYHHFNITLTNAYDIQVLDTASAFLKQVKFPYEKRKELRKIYGLGSTIDKMFFNGVSESEKSRLRAVKSEAKTLFSPDVGGSYEIWNQVRPLVPLLLEYCCDTRYFFSLYNHYDKTVRACLRFVSFGAYDLAQDALSRAHQRRIAHALSPDFDKSDREIMCRVDTQLLIDLCEIVHIHPYEMKVPNFDELEGAPVSTPVSTADGPIEDDSSTETKGASVLEDSDSFGGSGAGSF
jgi:exonuclease 3'-5' domain-containing protein 1